MIDLNLESKKSDESASQVMLSAWLAKPLGIARRNQGVVQQATGRAMPPLSNKTISKTRDTDKVYFLYGQNKQTNKQI
ncbi:MAG: hypothetical protein LBL04_02865 [Bacteroidales bacterium]|jgi:hypothetical protein|nr:hypothetical protein [Bacteroidales bacterium]